MKAANFRVYSDSRELAISVAQQINASLKSHIVPPRFCLALSGGNTPLPVYRELAQMPDIRKLLNEKTEIFFSDERPVPANHAESNYRAAAQALLTPLDIDPRHVHRMHGEATDLPGEAVRYSLLLEGKVSARSNDGVPSLDLIILGVGSDGHTASLFPDYKPHHDSNWVISPWVASKNTFRLSLSYQIINAAKSVFVIASGSDKAAIVKHAFEKTNDGLQLPIDNVKPAHLEWHIDRDAHSLCQRAKVSDE